MTTKHIKIKQLDTQSNKVSSNNDIVLADVKYDFHFPDQSFTFHAVPQLIQHLIQGLHYVHHQSLSKLTLSDDTPNEFKISIASDDYSSLIPKPLSDLNIQPTMIKDWVRQFKSQQTLYRKTGATESVGLLIDEHTILTIECLDFKTGILKLLGNIIKKQCPYYPILFISHKIHPEHVSLIDHLQPQLIICQSAIPDTALTQLIAKKCTVFGFCRKHKFNRYSNFHL